MLSTCWLPADYGEQKYRQKGLCVSTPSAMSWEKDTSSSPWTPRLERPPAHGRSGEAQSSALDVSLPTGRLYLHVPWTPQHQHVPNSMLYLLPPPTPCSSVSPDLAEFSAEPVGCLWPGYWLSQPGGRGTRNSNIKQTGWKRGLPFLPLTFIGERLSAVYWTLGATKDSDGASALEVTAASWERRAHK